MNIIKIEGSNYKESIINIDCDTTIYYLNTDINLDININNDIKLYEYIDNSKINNIYNLNNNLLINRFSINSNLNTKINLNNENINLNYFYSTINIDNNTYILDVIHNNKNTSSNVINNGINLLNNKLEFIINGIIKKESINTSCFQNSKILVMDENNSIIKPNILADNNQIDANHSAYIGKLDEEVLFYLKSRGINKNDATKLLIKSFLISDENDILKENVIEQINKYWR